jgi:hypothetical protein
MRAILAVAALALAGCSTPGNMDSSQTLMFGKYRAFSWGKANVSYDDYRTVAFECASRAVLSPVAAEDVFAVHWINAAPGIGVGVFEQHYAADQRARQFVIEACLQEFGFEAYMLSDEQLAVLETMPHGAEERRVYLHSLASDPAILTAQHY